MSISSNEYFCAALLFLSAFSFFESFCFRDAAVILILVFKDHDSGILRLRTMLDQRFQGKSLEVVVSLSSHVWICTVLRFSLCLPGVPSRLCVVSAFVTFQ